MARTCQKVSKRLSKPHIIVSLCHSLAKKAKFDRKFTFFVNLNWSINSFLILLCSFHEHCPNLIVLLSK
jgi:hypothetical protein